MGSNNRAGKPFLLGICMEKDLPLQPMVTGLEIVNLALASQFYCTDIPLSQKQGTNYGWVEKKKIMLPSAMDTSKEEGKASIFGQIGCF